MNPIDQKEQAGDRRIDRTAKEKFMAKDNDIEDSFADILAMLRKKIREKDEELEKLREENTKLKENLPETEEELLEETFKRR
jgi:hypothetical protein